MVVASAKGKDLGTKRVCAACGSKFYDFGRTDPTCPRCGALFDVNAAPVPATKPDRAQAEPDEEEVRRSRLLAGLDEDELAIAGKVEEDDDVDFDDDDDDDTESYDESDDDGDEKDKDGGDDW